MENWLNFFKIPTLVGAKIHSSKEQVAIATRSMQATPSIINFEKKELKNFPKNFQMKISEIEEDTTVSLYLLNDKGKTYSLYFLNALNPSIFISLNEVKKMKIVIPSSKKTCKVTFAT